MNRLLVSFVLSVLICLTCFAPPPGGRGGGAAIVQRSTGSPAGAAGGGGATADLVKEDFEGTGNPGSWGTGGTVNFDYTTTVLDGAQSLFLGASVSQTSTNWGSGKVELWGYFQFQIITTLGTPTLFELEEQFSTGQLIIDVSGSNLRICDSAGTHCASTTFGGMVADTKFHCWWHYKQITGANNDLGEVWVDTTGTKPTTGGSKYATVTTLGGDATAWIAEWFNLGGSSTGLIFDHCRISTIGDLGSNPP